MDVQQPALAALDVLLREIALFAATGFLVLGASDVAIDLIWVVRTAWRRFSGQGPADRPLEELPAPEQPGAIAVLVPAWDESRVIAQMLRHAVVAWGKADFVLFVGCYANDPATIAAAREVVDPRIRVVVGQTPGPTTKADCLNRLWEAMAADEAAAGRRFKAAVLHDAEDVVHSAELRIYDALIGRFDLVQLPVLPLIDPNSRWVAGHYADEFAEVHGKAMVVRGALGAALPSAGVGCAIARDALDRLATREGVPFDPDCLTEDYELGLRLRRDGGRAAFVRLRGPEGRLVAARAYFPGERQAAVAQKARWMRGIALSGWDRLGWGGGLAERWMRMRDRQALLAALILLCGYTVFVLWTLRTAASAAFGLPPMAIPEALQMLMLLNGALLAWRLGMRFGFVAEAYGWREGLRSVPRTVVGNFVAILAAREALLGYAGRGRGGWAKTEHAFPILVPAE